MFIFELETLRGKHCRHPIAKMGVVWALNAEIAAEKCWNCEEKKCTVDVFAVHIGSNASILRKMILVDQDH